MFCGCFCRLLGLYILLGGTLRLPATVAAGFVLGRLLSCLPFLSFVSDGRNGSIFLDESRRDGIPEVCCAFSYRFVAAVQKRDEKTEAGESGGGRGVSGAFCVIYFRGLCFCSSFLGSCLDQK